MSDKTNHRAPGQIKGFDRLTLNAKKLFNDAYRSALNFKNEEFLPIHVFYALLRAEKGVVTLLFEQLGIDIESTKERIYERIRGLDSQGYLSETKSPKFSEKSKDLINESYLVSTDLEHVYVGSEHVFLALFRMEGLDFVSEFKKRGITYALLKKRLGELMQYTIGAEDEGAGMLGGDIQSIPWPNFARDMNDRVQEGEFVKIEGRDEEVNRIIHILSRKTKNNPILVGEAGVGKTAIVEGFTSKIVKKDVPSSFMNKRIVSIDVSSIIAGARLRGDVEERIQFIIDKAMSDENIILFIDEIHNIVGAGTSGGRDTMDVANVLKPYLTDPRLSIIGATTYDEYNKFFDPDAALKRRFQPVFVEELKEEAATEVLMNVKKDLEEFHKVKIQKDAVKESVVLTKKFIKDRFLPDKAIDVIDEAAAKIKIHREVAIEPEMSKLGQKLIDAQRKKAEALSSKNFQAAAKYKDQGEKITDEIEEVMEGKKSVVQRYPKQVTTDLIKKVIVDWTKIPIAASDISDKTLKNLKKNILGRIVGQDHVVEEVSLAIQRSHLGFIGGERPLGSFLFLGPTGVGKTELAKMVAKELFGSKELVHQVNMSEFMEMHSVAKLIGSPPGYVGYTEGGTLTNFVRRKPYSVILFDEIEKAHPDTLNLLLQVLEEGKLQDGKGSTVSFSNTIVVMTSNIGAEEVSKDNKIGFDVDITEVEGEELDEAFEDMREGILEELRLTLSPEFINRIDAVEVFRGLNEEDSLQIAKLEVDELKLELLKTGIVLEVDSAVVDKINEEGYSKEYGARNIRRKIQEVLENGLASFFLQSDIKRKKKAVMKIKAKLVKGEVIFKVGR